jgi:hypothetical protein
MPTGNENVRSWGRTGSDQPTLKTALLTRNGPPLLGYLLAGPAELRWEILKLWEAIFHGENSLGIVPRRFSIWMVGLLGAKLSVRLCSMPAIPIATKFCIAPKCRDGPVTDINLDGHPINTRLELPLSRRTVCGELDRIAWCKSAQSGLRAGWRQY